MVVVVGTVGIVVMAAESSLGKLAHPQRTIIYDVRREYSGQRSGMCTYGPGFESRYLLATFLS